MHHVALKRKDDPAPIFPLLKPIPADTSPLVQLEKLAVAEGPGEYTGIAVITPDEWDRPDRPLQAWTWDVLVERPRPAVTFSHNGRRVHPNTR